MKRPLAQKTFNNLLRYYITILEEENLLATSFSLADQNITYFTNITSQEPFFQQHNTQITIPTTTLPTTLLQQIIKPSKNQFLYYGYPLYLDEQKTIIPLFYTKLALEHEPTTNNLRITPQHPILNHALLNRFMFEIEEIKKIRQQIQHHDFATQLKYILDLLPITKPIITTSLDTTPLDQQKTQHIINNNIFYLGNQPSSTKNLIHELTHLIHRPYTETMATSLGYFLGEQPTPQNKKHATKDFLMIYPLNQSQQQAVHHALTQPLTIITGPPGTGKSQVVLNIIANAIHQNKTILFSSKNNKAVDVVREKLQPLLAQPLLIRMGAQPYRWEARKTLKKLLQDTAKKPSYPQKLTYQKLQRLTKEKKVIAQQLEHCQFINSEIDRLQDIIIDLTQNIPLTIQTHSQNNDFNEINNDELEHELNALFKTRNLVIKIKKKLFPQRHQHHIHHLFLRYMNQLQGTTKNIFQTMINNTTINEQDALHLLLKCKQQALDKEKITALQHQLNTYEPITVLLKKLRQLEQEYVKESRTIFNTYFLTKFNTMTTPEQNILKRYLHIIEQREQFINDPAAYKKLDMEYKKKAQSILRFLPAWVITNLSAKTSIPLKNNLFDILIIDEASQCDIASALPLLFRAQQAVIIGDPHQLKHISLIEEQTDTTLASHFKINDIHTTYSYNTNSLYDLAAHIFTAQGHQPILLDEHYRCTRNIISFSNNYFYNKLLHILTDEHRLIPSPEQLPHGIIWYDIVGETIRSTSSFNIQEADHVIKVLEHITQQFPSTVSVGVVTLFRAHMELIQKKINEHPILSSRDITVGTSHRFQGDEKDVIIFSPAVSKGIKDYTLRWIQSTTQLINVAITRAKTTVLIVGDYTQCSQTQGILADLALYAQKEHHDLFDNDVKRILAELLTQQHIPIHPTYHVHSTQTEHMFLDFALFIGKRKYALEITPNDTTIMNKDSVHRHITLRHDGWGIRYISAEQIISNLGTVLEDIKRLC